MSTFDEQEAAPGDDCFAGALKAFLEGDWADAARLFEAALQLDLVGRSRGDALCFRGIALCHLRESEDALGCFESALQLPDEERPDLIANDDLRHLVFQNLDVLWPVRASALEESVGADAARRYLQGRLELIDLLPGHHLPNAHSDLGIYFANANNLRAAEECFERALLAENVFPEAMYDDYLEIVQHVRESLDIVRRDLQSELSEAPQPESEESSPVESSKAPSRSPCFIATACYGDGDHPDVVTLRRFRDEVLTAHATGRGAIWVYERLSPSIAGVLEHAPRLRELIRTSVVHPLASRVSFERGGSGRPGTLPRREPR